MKRRIISHQVNPADVNKQQFSTDQASVLDELSYLLSTEYEAVKWYDKAIPEIKASGLDPELVAELVQGIKEIRKDEEDHIAHIERLTNLVKGVDVAEVEASTNRRNYTKYPQSVEGSLFDKFKGRSGGKKSDAGNVDVKKAAEDIVHNIFYDIKPNMSEYDYQKIIQKAIDNKYPNLKNDKEQAPMAKYAKLQDAVLQELQRKGKISASAGTKIEADTVKKKNGKWVNRGDTGEEHGEFATKKEADAQRKAMYATGYKG